MRTCKCPQISIPIPPACLPGKGGTISSADRKPVAEYIVVRNSIILVDFIELRLREGLPLEQAVVDAGAVRFRPMALTAAVMIVGAAVILFDPIFQGLAISLMAGEVASLLLSRMAVPVLYYMAKRRERSEPMPTAAPMEAAA